MQLPSFSIFASAMLLWNENRTAAFSKINKQYGESLFALYKPIYISVWKLQCNCGIIYNFYFLFIVSVSITMCSPTKRIERKCWKRMRMNCGKKGNMQICSMHRLEIMWNGQFFHANGMMKGMMFFLVKPTYYFSWLSISGSDGLILRCWSDQSWCQYTTTEEKINLKAISAHNTLDGVFFFLVVDVDFLHWILLYKKVKKFLFKWTWDVAPLNEEIKPSASI